MMAIPAREAPTRSPLRRTSDAVHPVVEEPRLETEQIQGNILAGFNKDYQTLLFLAIEAPRDFKQWLRAVEPFIATLDEVLSFNRLFKKLSQRRGRSRTLQATWINIAFSYQGLVRLTPGAATFRDRAFRAGLAARSASLGDPKGRRSEGHPANWVVGGPGNEADVVLIVASDDKDDLLAEVERLESSIYRSRSSVGGPPPSGARLLYKQHGAILPGPLRGHEHFGFLDGVSQPGLRGLVSDDPSDVLTPRQNPTDREQGKPGQDLLWPGEFVFGYPRQNPRNLARRGSSSIRAPAWARNGSYLVIRRLRQDVPAFDRFLHDTAARLGIPAALLGAKCVGRWQSGAPILRAENADNIALADSDCANNHFEFREASPALRPEHSQGPEDCTDLTGGSPGALFPVSPGDPAGLICPHAGHIRRAYPRDDIDEAKVQTHRLLRRGIPYGAPYEHDPADTGDRGLLFLAYQTSIERQFEHVTSSFINDPNFGDPGAGHDPIIGQNSAVGSRRERTLRLKLVRGGGPSSIVVRLRQEWVIPTGGGYFFAPSMDALRERLST